MNLSLVNEFQKQEKRTLVKAYVNKKISTTRCICISAEQSSLLVGEKWMIEEVLKEQGASILYQEVVCVNSSIPLKDTSGLSARVEPGAYIREGVSIGKNAIILMGAIINIGASIGDETMIDMNAVIGSKAQIGKGVHVGAGSVIAGVLEPASKKEVVIHDHVMIGANAVILEGIEIGEGAVIGAGSVVTKDVKPYSVVVGVPAKEVKERKEVAEDKVAICEELRNL